MINKKLLSFDRGALRYVELNVLFQWLGMLCNVVFVKAVAGLIGAAFAGSLTSALLWQQLVLCLATVPLRFACTMLASGMSDRASKDVKRTLRSNIYDKLTRLGPNYTETAATSEVVMLASEGVEQIDTYFAKYLPQLFYSLLAPVTLFALLVGVHARSAIILLCCVPLIPMSIVAVQKFAKKLLANKQILAQIMKGCVDEYSECSVDEIAEKYIEGTPEVGTVGVHVDDTNRPPKAPDVITGSNNEDSTLTEGTINYDVRFDAIAPTSEGSTAQKDVIRLMKPITFDFPQTCGQAAAGYHAAAFRTRQAQQRHGRQRRRADTPRRPQLHMQADRRPAAPPACPPVHPRCRPGQGPGCRWDSRMHGHPAQPQRCGNL